MKICFLVDARSPIACNWIRYFLEPQHDVHIISSYPCAPADYPQATVYESPVALANFSRATQQAEKRADHLRPKSPFASWRGRLTGTLSLAAQHAILPFDVGRQVEHVNRLLVEISPDLIHAMRIPFEGILAAKAAPRDLPLLISVWGNDFTMWASRNPMIAGQTEETLRRADALHADCHRDLRLAIRDWHFNRAKPAAVLPSAGGIQTSLFYRAEPDAGLKKQLQIGDDQPVMINSRGLRGYVRNDIFFEAIPLVLRHYPRAVFLCVAMQGQALAESWVQKLGIQAQVRLLPSLPRAEMAALFRLAAITVSPSLHDGTPNTLLEAMACGCFPVAGDIESVREWIIDGTNGLLCDATDKRSLAEAMIRALQDEPLRRAAQEKNLQLIDEHAEYNQVMRKVEAFYEKIVAYKQQGKKV